MTNLSRSSLEQLPTEELRKIALSLAQNRLATLDSREHSIKNWRWRLDNLYWVLDENGNRVKFKCNSAQDQFLKEMHECNIILKARQLGFSTLIQLLMLDACVFNNGIRCGTIAHTRPDAEDIFRDKAKYPYDQLEDGIKAKNPATQDAARHLSFANDSSIRVGTSLRSGTFQYLHISEYGKICARYPEKAREVKTGALNTVHVGQMVFVESTAEGQEGHFYEMCQEAQKRKARKTALTKLDFKFHFYPWWRDPKYSLDGTVTFTSEQQEYFEELKRHGIELTHEQRVWYVVKATSQDEDMYREFPSIPEEAFKADLQGAYYGKLIRKIEEKAQIGHVPHDPGLSVETWWDLGMNDMMSIWFVQRQGLERRFIDFEEHSGEGLGFYAELLQEKRQTRGFVYERHLWPHDGNVRILDEKGRARTDVMRDLGYEVEVVERGLIQTGIEAVRNLLPFCWFDEEHCEDGVRHLRNYRKEWDENLGTFKKTPRHDEHSHGADAFRTGASFQPLVRRKGQRLSPKVAIV